MSVGVVLTVQVCSCNEHCIVLEKEAGFVGLILQLVDTL